MTVPALLLATALVAAGPSPLDRALGAAQAGDDALAADLLLAALDAGSDPGPVLAELAAALNRMGRPAEALRVAAHAAELLPDDHRPQLERARALATLGEPDAAIEAYRDAISCADRPALHLELAALHLTRHDPEAAIGAIAAAERAEPGLRLDGLAGHTLFAAGRHRDAATAFARAAAAGRIDPSFAVEHGRALEALADLAGAQAVYRRAAERFPADPRLQRRLGAVLLDLGRPEEAVAPLLRARDLDPRAAETFEKLGLALARSGRAAEAETALGEAIRLDPGFARAHYALGTLLAESGRGEEAEAALARFRAIEQERKDADRRQGEIATLNREGLRLYREGRAGEAAAVFRQAVALGPRHGAVHANLALALLALGHGREALAAVDGAVALDGETAALLALRARAVAATR